MVQGRGGSERSKASAAAPKEAGEEQLAAEAALKARQETLAQASPYPVVCAITQITHEVEDAFSSVERHGYPASVVEAATSLAARMDDMCRTWERRLNLRWRQLGRKKQWNWQSCSGS